MHLAEIATFTDDVEGMTAFYRVLLKAEPVAASADMALFLSGETRIFIHRAYDPRPGDLPAENHIAFAVPDVDAAYARLVSDDLIVEVPPTNYEWGRSAYLRDPSGRLIELSQSS